MIDFIKCLIDPQYKTSLLNNPLLDYNSEVNDYTGEVFEQKASYKNLLFTIHDKGYIKLTGSLHKYWNGGLHNYNDFSFNSLQVSLNSFERDFGIDLIDCKFQNIEVGVNINPPIPTNDLLKGIQRHRLNDFRYISMRGGNFKEATSSERFIKAYNKALQYKVNDEIFRFENKHIKSRGTSIKTMEDLRNKSIVEIEVNRLVNDWDNIFYYDSDINISSLSEKNQVKFWQWSDVEYWKGCSREKRSRELIQYNEIINIHSNRVKEKTKILLISKSIQLLKT